MKLTISIDFHLDSCKKVNFFHPIPLVGQNILEDTERFLIPRTIRKNLKRISICLFV